MLIVSLTFIQVAPSSFVKQKYTNTTYDKYNYTSDAHN